MVESSAEAVRVPPKSMAASPKKKTTAKVKAVVSTETRTKVAKVASVYPPTSTMVINAIKTLNEGRGGSSIQAIKKSISNTYKVEPEKFSLRVKKYLKSAVEKGELIQTKGKGATGSFKLPPSKPQPKKTAAPKKKPAATKKEKSTETKKAKASSKKPAAAKEVVDKPKAVSKPKAITVTSPKKAPAPSKTKVAKSTPVKKLKSPKPKKVIAKKTAVKKTVAKK